MTTRIFASLILPVAVLLTACSHREPSPTQLREPASTAAACSTLERGEADVFRAVVNTDRGVAASMQYLAELAHILGYDHRHYDKERLTIELFRSDRHGIALDRLEAFARLLIQDCEKLRDGKDLNPQFPYRQNQLAYDASNRCGFRDDDLNDRVRTHPGVVRDWTRLGTEGHASSISEWVSLANGLYEPGTGRIISPEGSAEACSSLQTTLLRKSQNRGGQVNVEDVIETLFVCLDGFILNLAEYDNTTATYARNGEGQLKLKSRSPALESCLQGYARGEVRPDSADAPSFVAARVQQAGASAVLLTTDSDRRKGESRSKAAAKQTGRDPHAMPLARATGAVVKGLKPADPARAAQPQWKQGANCLPGDDRANARCRANPCIAELAHSGRPDGSKLPATLSSRDMEQFYRYERDRYRYDVARHVAERLGQVYLGAAIQRLWRSPKELNQNLQEYAASCGHNALRKSLATMMSKESLNEELVDGRFDLAFADIRDHQATLGQRTIGTAEQLVALGKLRGLLEREMAWDTDHNVYGQCPKLNMPGYPLPADASLLTSSDAELRRLLENERFRTTAFCANDPDCAYPREFERYLRDTDPRAVASMSGMGAPGTRKISMRAWCGMRREAAASLRELEHKLISLYPALAYVEKKSDGRPGAPLFETLAALSVSQNTEKGREARARAAAARSEQVLPLIQNDLKKLVSKVCEEIRNPLPETLFLMTLANHAFVSDFDRCAEIDVGSRRDAPFTGLSCRDESQFLACQLTEEVAQWDFERHLPEMAVETITETLNAAAILTVAGKGLTFLTSMTLRRAVIGGLTGTAFTFAHHKLTELITMNTRAAWSDYYRTIGSTMTEGVDSYTSAILSVSESQPHLGLQDFVTGFVFGAVLAPEAGKPGIKTSGRPKGGKPALGDRLTGVARELAQSAEKTRDGKVRFSASTTARIKSWMQRENGDLADELIRNMGERLVRMSEREYQALLAGPERALALARVQRALGLRVRRLSAEFVGTVGRLKSTLAQKARKAGKLSADERVLSETNLQAVDLAKTVELLGPRETALLARELELASRINPKEAVAARTGRVAGLLEKVEGLRAFCPGEGCHTAVREAFWKEPPLFKKLSQAVEGWRHRKGRADADRMERILDEQWAVAQAEARNRHAGQRLEPEAAWREHVERWTQETIERTGNPKTYPSLDELAAVMMANDPVLQGLSRHFLSKQGRFRFYAMSRIKRYKNILRRKTGAEPLLQHDSWLDLRQPRLRLPIEFLRDKESFNTLLARVDSILLGNEPSIMGSWYRAIAQVGRSDLGPESISIMHNFRQIFLREYEARYRALLSEATTAIHGQARPEVVEGLMKYGFENRVNRWVAGWALRLKGKNPSTHPEFAAEARALALNMTFVIETVFQAMLYYQAIDMMSAEADEPLAEEMFCDPNAPRFTRSDKRLLQMRKEDVQEYEAMLRRLKAETAEARDPQQKGELQAEIRQIEKLLTRARSDIALKEQLMEAEERCARETAK